MPEEKKTVVIGVGNILMGDDGLGIYAVELLRQENLPPQVEVVDGGTAGIDLIYLLEEAEYALIIDCLDCGETPGMMFRIPWGEISDGNREEQIVSLHDMNLWSVLSLAEKLNKLPQVVIFGAQPETIALGQGLSPAVKDAVYPLVQAIIREIYQIYGTPE